MKRMLKKLAAIALVGAMALSLSVSALATGTPTISGMGAQGSASGQVESQGRIPDDVVRVRMPLTAANVFDMYVDPHNLIRESANAMEVGGAGTAVDLFATDTLVYFPNKTDGSLTGFSKTSDPIQVTNMSNVPVTIDMTATWTMGGTNSYDLANSADDLAASKTAGDAALYLTLDDTLGHSAAVVKADKGTPTLTYSVAPPDTQTVTSGNTNTLKNLPSFIKNIKFEFTKDAVAEDIKLLNEGGAIWTGTTEGATKTPADWKLTFTKSDKKTPTVAFDTAQLPTYTTMSGTAPNQTLKRDNAYTVKYVTQNVSITPALQMDGTYTYSVPNDKAETQVTFHRGTSGAAVAIITIEWDYEAIAENSYDVTEVLEDSTNSSNKDTYTMKVTGATGSGAKLSNDLNTTEDSYKLIKNEAGTALKWEFNEDKGFTAEAVEKFQSVSFSLTAAITDGEVCAKAWDDAFDSAVKSQLDVVWAVSQCSAVDPTVTVTSPLTSATGSAELKVDWGYGDAKATAIKSVSFTAGSSNGTVPEANITVDGATVTISAANANGLFAEAGANGVVTITFTTMSGEKDVEVNLKTAAT